MPVTRPRPACARVEPSGKTAGRAIRTGASLVLLAAALAGGTVGCKPSEPTPGSANRAAPAAEQWLEDITARTGVEFLHDSGATGSYFMPESTGSGGALFDFDNDGRLDLYLVHCAPPASKSRNRLFHQQSDGRFRDVSEGSGLDVTGHGMGAAAGDVNNDGLPDLLLTEYGAARLFVNLGGGKFRETGAAAGIDNPRWATAAAFFDYNRDGWLDLVIANYVDYTPTQKCFDTRGAQEYCGPQGMAGTATRLFRNLGAATARAGDRDRPARFEDVTVRSGLAQKIGPALGVFCADFDGDRWPDIFLTDDGQPNRLFVNQRNGTFTEQAPVRGLAYNALGGLAANMGIAHGDTDGDGLFDLFVTHLNWEQHALWRQGPRGLFQDQIAASGLASPAWRGAGFGAVLADFDLDGAPDLAFVNGLIKRGNDPAPRVPGLPAFWSPYAQRSQLFANDGSGRFRDVSAANPDFCGLAAVGRGLACGDLDNDGAPDLVVMNAGSATRLFRNVAPRRGRWLAVRAIDPALGGRDAYGAEIIVEAGGRKWWRLAQPGYSYLTSNDPRVHFGLGQISSVDRLRVFWPDGTEEIFPGGDPDRLVVLHKGAGRKP
jgi:hypothetical protein